MYVWLDSVIRTAGVKKTVKAGFYRPYCNWFLWTWADTAVHNELLYNTNKHSAAVVSYPQKVFIAPLYSTVGTVQQWSIYQSKNYTPLPPTDDIFPSSRDRPKKCPPAPCLALFLPLLYLFYPFIFNFPFFLLSFPLIPSHFPLFSLAR